MAALTIQPFVKSGNLNASYVAASGGGDTMANDGQTILHVKNGGGAPINVTLTAQTTMRDGGPGYGPYTLGNLVVSVTNGQDRFIGPFPTKAFNDGNGNLAIAYSAVTSVTVAALKVPA